MKTKVTHSTMFVVAVCSSSASKVGCHSNLSPTDGFGSESIDGESASECQLHFSGKFTSREAGEALGSGHRSRYVQPLATAPAIVPWPTASSTSGSRNLEVSRDKVDVDF